MNTLLFNCPNCNQEMRLPASIVGQKGKCPSCAEVIIPVPALGSLTEGEPAPLLPVQSKEEPAPSQPVQLPAVTEDVPLKMGSLHFAERNLATGEKIIHAGRCHPCVKWICIISFLTLSIGSGIVLSNFVLGNAGSDSELPFANPLITIGFFSSWFAVIFGYIYLDISRTELVLTNKRLLSKQGVLFIKTRGVQLKKVGSIDFSRGLLEALFGCGRITIRNTGGVKGGKFRYLADALEFRRRILAQIDRVQT